MAIRASQPQTESEYNTKCWNALSTLLLQCIKTFPRGHPIQETEKYNQSAVKTLLSPLNIQLLCQNSLLRIAFHIASSGSGKVSAPAISADHLLKQLLPLIFHQQSQNNLSSLKLKILKGLNALMVSDS